MKPKFAATCKRTRKLSATRDFPHHLYVFAGSDTVPALRAEFRCRNLRDFVISSSATCSVRQVSEKCPNLIPSERGNSKIADSYRRIAPANSSTRFSADRGLRPPVIRLASIPKQSPSASPGILEDRPEFGTRMTETSAKFICNAVAEQVYGSQLARVVDRVRHTLPRRPSAFTFSRRANAILLAGLPSTIASLIAKRAVRFRELPNRPRTLNVPNNRTIGATIRTIGWKQRIVIWLLDFIVLPGTRSVAKINYCAKCGRPNEAILSTKNNRLCCEKLLYREIVCSFVPFGNRSRRK